MPIETRQAGKIRPESTPGRNGLTLPKHADAASQPLSNPARVLLVETSAQAGEQILRSLRSGGFDAAHRRVASLPELAQEMETGDWSAVVSAYHLSGCSGLDALKVVRARSASLPFVLVCGGLGEEMAVAAIKAGASDCIRRTHLSRLSSVLTVELANHAAKVQEDHSGLALQKRLTDKVFAQGREGVVVTDAQGHIVMVNHAFTLITGYSDTDVMGKHSRMLSSGRESPEFFKAMWDALLTQGDWAGEIWNRRKDGTVYPEWLTISSVCDDHGNLTHFVGNFSDLSDSKEAESRIQWLSNFDPLTGLPNRTLLQDRTSQAINMVQRTGEPITLMLLGIDHFKTINDTQGYLAGDELLAEMGARLSAAVRKQDTVARISGKEFALVLPGTALGGAAYLATELLKKVAVPHSLGGSEVALTASIGIATFPDNGRGFEALYRAAEIAMHRAQANGRNTFQFYSDEMFRHVRARDHMNKALRSAAELDQLQLAYQPLVDLKTGKISGMEALLRWHHPDLGAVSPAQFIPLAEESGLIKSIGEWVLRRACRDIRLWLDKGIEVPHVAVNVSPVQFRDPTFIAQVSRALADFQVAPRHLFLEVTESALMDDIDRSEAVLKNIKSLGLRLSLDDFGTGYSSLSYLKRFPFDKVKIDQSFVRDITTSESDHVIVKVIVAMGHGLGLTVIAEGVETEAQCGLMRNSLCDEIQGYLFSKPVTATAIEALFHAKHQLAPHLLHTSTPL